MDLPDERDRWMGEVLRLPKGHTRARMGSSQALETQSIAVGKGEAERAVSLV